MDLVNKVASVFKEKFKCTPVSFIAPGRINLIGEHTDYNEGFVMPSAVDKYMVFSMAVSGDDRCNIYSADLEEGVTFSLHDLNPGQAWVNYLMGVLDAFQRRGLLIHGADCVFGGNIPSGAGLSSSAALCCGFAFAVNKLFKLGLSRLELAKIAQSSEHNFIGVMCGIMDQYASLFSHHASVLLLDCRSLTHQILPISLQGHEILLIDSNVKHSLASTAYNDRRAACEEGVRIIAKKHPEVTALRDVTLPMLIALRDDLSPNVYEKCRFIVEEIDRAQRGAVMIQSGDIRNFGNLMYETHWGLSKSYEVSCDESDLLVTLANEHREQVPGARQMGGGFGGCTINLVRSEYKEIFTEDIRKKYFASFKKEPDFYSVNLADGVHQLSAH